MVIAAEDLRGAGTFVRVAANLETRVWQTSCSDVHVNARLRAWREPQKGGIASRRRTPARCRTRREACNDYRRRPV